MSPVTETHPERHFPSADAPRAASPLPLPWSPFLVRHAAGADEVAGDMALHVAHARAALDAATGRETPVRLLVDDGAAVAAWNAKSGAIEAGAVLPPGFDELARMLDDRLPPRARLSMRRRYGPGSAPLDLAPFARTLAIDAYAQSVAHAAGSAFPRAWLALAWGATARVVTLASASPDTLSRDAQLAESAGAVLPPSFAIADLAVRDALLRIEATRDAVHAVERHGPELLVRFLRAFPHGMAPRGDRDLARLVLRELRDAAFLPTMEALAA
ncbi:MAG: hypothetical protein IT520_15005 [Burkholderiales bacterium]|nr:hypothetical protein [Burkholderiales bacterium]